jgi:adenosylcobinamide kinase/adenosylcobinamide-phosphate guanylyltransferase
MRMPSHETGTGSVILVSNEVCMGVVPETPLGRGFRDHAGRLNQRIVAVADTVVFMVAVLPWYFKGNPGSGGV